MGGLQTGKLSPDDLKRIILQNLGHQRDDVLVHAGIGEDSAVIDFGEEVCIVSTDPITGAEGPIGELAVHVSLNDIAANGAQPLGIQVVLLMPDGSSGEDVRAITTSLHETACRMQIEILGGHTEVTDLITRPIISITAIGKAKKEHYVTSGGAQPGDAIIMTKTAGLEGTAIIASDHEELLLNRGIDPQTIQQAKQLSRQISIIEEAQLAVQNGATAMHDVTEGGVLGALYELGEASKTGFDVEPHRIPVAPSTEKICRVLDIDPLTLVSSGTLLITSPDPENLVRILGAASIQVTVIGTMTSGERYELTPEGTRVEFRAPYRDALWSFLDQDH